MNGHDRDEAPGTMTHPLIISNLFPQHPLKRDERITQQRLIQTNANINNNQPLCPHVPPRRVNNDLRPHPPKRTEDETTYLSG